ncbi:transcription antitermination factor NusB [Spirulina sp. 06S082]|uniref:transcription antitermination factor NusB n=1 Tax=Spirulina sp. 06S082 TaxID=3110248 RepID=UPI003A4D6560
MMPRQQPRQTSRELALLSLSQVRGNSEKIQQQTLNDLVLAAIRTLVAEARDTLSTASEEIQRGADRLASSDTRATDIQSSKTMVKEAIELTEKALNRVGYAADLPEFIYLADRQDVQEYALELIGTVKRRRSEITEAIESSLVDWQFHRIPQVDRDILSLAVAEIVFLNIPTRVAINEAVELAKRYSDEEGSRFINGVLRKVVEGEKIKEFPQEETIVET